LAKLVVIDTGNGPLVKATSMASPGQFFAD